MTPATANRTWEIHRAEDRGGADFGWLNANYSFSFARWFNSERMGFGALRVLNDDIIKAGYGFNTHPHEHMEIVTIPLEGGLRHKDSTGNEGVIRAGEVQLMSAGTGIQHSEHNASREEDAKTLQIWVFPDGHNYEPRYFQRSFTEQNRTDEWQTLVSPEKSEGNGLPIRQNAWFKRGKFSGGQKLELKAESSENGMYVFLIDGEVEADGEPVKSRDALAIHTSEGPELSIQEDADILLIEVPLQ